MKFSNGISIASFLDPPIILSFSSGLKTLDPLVLNHSASSLCSLEMTQSILFFQHAWTFRIVGNLQFILFKKFQVVKVALKTWNNEVFGRVNMRLSSALQDTQQILFMDPTNTSLLENERLVRLKLFQERHRRKILQTKI